MRRPGSDYGCSMSSDEDQSLNVSAHITSCNPDPQGRASGGPLELAGIQTNQKDGSSRFQGEIPPQKNRQKVVEKGGHQAHTC